MAIWVYHVRIKWLLLWTPQLFTSIVSVTISAVQRKAGLSFEEFPHERVLLRCYAEFLRWILHLRFVEFFLGSFLWPVDLICLGLSGCCTLSSPLKLLYEALTRFPCLSNFCFFFLTFFLIFHHTFFIINLPIYLSTFFPLQCYWEIINVITVWV